MRYPLVSELVFELLGRVLNALQFVILQSIQVIAVDLVLWHGLWLTLAILASLVLLLLFDKQTIEYEKLLELLISLQLPEKLLRMRPCLCTSASSDVVLDLNPIFAEDFKALDEFFVFFLRPSTPMRVDVIRGFSLKSSDCHRLRCVILLLSYIRISEAHALGGNSHQAEVILVQRRFVLVSNSAIR